MTKLLITENQYQIAHVGDSRGYLFRNNELHQITDDHSVAFQQYKAGAISKDEIRLHPNQRQLTRCFNSYNDFVIAEYHEGEVLNGDIFLFCSVGLTKEITDEEIAEYLMDNDNLATCPERLVSEIQKRGGKDDNTIIIVSVLDPPRKQLHFTE